MVSVRIHVLNANCRMPVVSCCACVTWCAAQPQPAARCANSGVQGACLLSFDGAIFSDTPLRSQASARSLVYAVAYV